MKIQELRDQEIRSIKSEPILVHENDVISKVVGLLRERKRYEAFVNMSDKVGMITVRDILRVADITSTKVSTIANPVPKLSASDPVSEAARLMSEYRVRALPIVDKGDVIGEASALSIVRAIADGEETIGTVNHIMTIHPITVNEDDSAVKASNLMLRRKIDHLPVLKDRRLTGILTSSNMVFRILPPSAEKTTWGIEKRKRKLDFQVKKIMEDKPLTCQVKDPIQKVARKMIDQDTTYSIATTWDGIDGIVTYRDFVGLLAQQRRTQEIPAYIVGLPDNVFEAEYAKKIFTNAVKNLGKSIRGIEARSTIKSKKTGGRPRYEVRVSLRTPGGISSYTEGGRDLVKIYTAISEKMGRMISRRPREKSKLTRRRAEELP